MIYITTAQAYTIGRTYGLRIDFNAPLAGTLTVSDDNGIRAIVAIGTTAAKIYYGFTGVVTITTSATENVTVSLLNNQG